MELWTPPQGLLVLQVDPRTFISSKLPGDASPADAGTTLEAALAYTEAKDK